MADAVQEQGASQNPVLGTVGLSLPGALSCIVDFPESAHQLGREAW